MASAATLTPPPGTDAPPPGAAPTSPGASPAPPQQSSAQGTTQVVINFIHAARALAMAIPKNSPAVQKINDIIKSELMPELMQSQRPGEPMAPPTAG